MLLILLFFSLPAGAATFTVTSLNDSGAGSLRQAVLDANAAITSANTIGFQAGLTGTIILTSGTIEISGRLTITGPGADVLAVSGNKVSRVFTVAGPGPTTIQGLTIKEGREELGGGIYSARGFLTLNHLTFSNNLAMNAVNGASSGLGGGLYNEVSTLTVMNSTLSDNAAGGAGGGIGNWKGTLTVSNSTLSGNIAGSGGGITCESAGATLTVINSTLSGNVAGGYSSSGGGIKTYDSKLTVINSTLTSNTANQYGGGISSFGTTTVNNSLIVGNTAPTGKEAYQAYGTGSFISGYNLFGENGLAGVENVTLLATDQILAGLVDSAIGPLANNSGPTQTYLLVAGSPAINKGNNSLIPAGITTDQRGAGFPRIVDTTVDIGAVEGTTTGPITYALTTSKTGGNGTVTSNPAGIDCGTTCTANFNSGTSVTLTATPDSGYNFTGWSGACNNISGTCTVTMDTAKSVTALFANAPPPTYPLTVSKAGTGAGTVTSNPAGIDCGATCSAQFSGSVTLIATPTGGSTFAGWSGACTTSSEPCAVTMTAAQNVTATFTAPPPAYLLIVTLAGAGNGIVTSNPVGIECGATCNAQFSGSVTLTASPVSGSVFGGWSGACSNLSGPCTISMTAAKTVTATFKPAPPSAYLLTITPAGAGSGVVTSTPVGIECGSACSANFTGSVTLTATPASGSTFAKWGGACTNLSGPCTVTMTAAQKVTATFNPIAANTYPLTVSTTGVGTGTITSAPAGIDCGLSCIANFGGTVTLTATPASGSTFGGWLGACANSSGPCTVSMTAAQAVIATFNPAVANPYRLTIAKNGAGTGTITSTPLGIACGATCSATFTGSVSLIATPSIGSSFAGWTPANCGSPFTLVADTTCTATFTAVTGPLGTTGGSSFSVMNHAAGTAAYATGINTLGQLGAGPTGAATGAQPQSADYYYFPTWVWWPYQWSSPTADPADAADVALAASGSPDFASVASGLNHTIALRRDGTVWAWGANPAGQLGDGTTLTRYQPVQVVTGSTRVPLTGVTAIAVGAQHSVAVKKDGTVWAWGSNQYGQLGDNSPPEVKRLYPVQVRSGNYPNLAPLRNIKAVAASDLHTIALTNAGTVWAWGANTRGQLGLGTTQTRRTATLIPGLTQVQTITARGKEADLSQELGISARNIVQRRDGALWGWGDNRYCQLGDRGQLGAWISKPVLLPSLSQLGVGLGNLASGAYHGVAWRPDGTAWTWGNNSQGQLGDNTTTERCSPIRVAGLTGVSTVGAGQDHTLITTGDGAVWGWGNNDRGQLGVGDANPRLIPTRMRGEGGVGFLNLKAAVTTPLTLTKIGTGAGTITGPNIACGLTCGQAKQLYALNAKVTLTAAPAVGSTFGGWTGCAPLAANPRQCTVILSQARSVVARFTTPAGTAALAVSKTGVGTGTVKNTSPLPAGKITCGTACVANFLTSQTVTLLATPDAGSRFGSWQGCTPKVGVPLQCTVPMNQARRVIATFNK
jgi:alpha-tubulin suppressor-like RCC1 family protein